jgi:glutamine synthetase
MSRQVELVSFVTSDLTGILRGRSFPRQQLKRRLRDGVGWVPANQSLTPFGGIAETDPHGSTGDLRLIPDPDAGVEVTLSDAEPPLAFYLCDIRELDGSEYECCPRTLLRRAAETLEDEFGLEARVSFEHEFVRICDEPSEPPFSLRAQRVVAGLGEAIVAALTEAGAEPEMFLPEYGPHQFELTCAPAAPVVAADRAAICRELVREVARVRGHKISFSPVTSEGGVGNGVHIHISLTPRDGGRDAQGDGLGAAEGAFAAGVLRHARALCALTAPSAISYLRLRPHSWSAATVALGTRNRETLLRICGPADEPVHLEYRAADAAACPHLALAALLLAGIEGLRAGLPAPPTLDEDPERADSQLRARVAPTPIPGDLGEALEALVGDEVASGWFSPLLLETYVGAKRAELAAVDGLSVPARLERYREIY